MSSSLERLVPVLDGTNYRDWAVMMQSYLQLQELWEVVGGSYRMPTLPAQGASASDVTAFREAFALWNIADNKATGAITLCITASLRHYHGANQSARTFWGNLKTAFGAASMPVQYADFKLLINTKLSEGNPIPEMEHMATLIDRLATNSLTLADNLQGLILLAAVPGKWDSVAQLFMQRDNLITNLTFPNVRAVITQEYERTGRPVNSSARKLSAVKHKGPDPSYRSQLQPGPSRQHQGHPQQRSGPPKRRGGRQEKEKKERRACKALEHNHSHFASASMVPMDVEPQPAPTWINALQPSRTTPLHSSIASFGKNRIEYRTVFLEAPKPVPAKSMWPSLNEAWEVCDALTIPKTAKNLKPLEAPKVPAPIKLTADPFDSYEKAAQAVSKMMKPKPVASNSKGKGKLVTRIQTPLFYPSLDLEHFENYEQIGFDWAADRTYHDLEYCKHSQESLVSPGDSGSIHDDEYNFDESDDDEGASRQLDYINRRMNVLRGKFLHLAISFY